jgi:parallel beta-helix repeat protein
MTYNNTVKNCDSQGIYLYHNPFDNRVYNNILIATANGIEASDDSKNKEVFSNTS